MESSIQKLGYCSYKFTDSASNISERPISQSVQYLRASNISERPILQGAKCLSRERSLSPLVIVQRLFRDAPRFKDLLADHLDAPPPRFNRKTGNRERVRGLFEDVTEGVGEM